jgi:prepilin peptidase CpaA
MAEAAAPIALLLVAALLLYAALHDIAARTIPDLVPGALAAAGIVLRLLAGDLLAGLAAAAIVFALTAFAWWRGWMVGGDVKLLAATALVVAPASVPGFVLAVALAGGVLAMTYLFLGRFLTIRNGPRPSSLPRRALRAEAWRIGRRGPLPYGVAIAAGAIFTLAA